MYAITRMISAERDYRENVRLVLVQPDAIFLQQLLSSVVMYQLGNTAEEFVLLTVEICSWR